MGSGADRLPRLGRHSSRLKLVRALRRTSARRAEGATVLEGPHLLESLLAAVEAGRSSRSMVRFFLVTPEAASAMAADGRLDRLAALGVEGAVVPGKDLHAISDTESPPGVLVVIGRPEAIGGTPVRASRILLADGIADPGNLGTLIRSAAAFGFDEVVAAGGVDLSAPKVLRASAGACFSVSLRSSAEPAALVDELRAGNIDVIAAVARGGEPPRAGGRGFVLVVGSESHGVRPELLDRASRRVTVPIAAGVESLNAAVAGSILMHALTSLGPGE